LGACCDAHSLIMSGAEIRTVSICIICDPNAVIVECIDRIWLEAGVIVSVFSNRLSYVLSVLHDP